MRRLGLTQGQGSVLFRATLDRVPFTLALVVTILTVTSMTGTIADPITQSQLNRWGWSVMHLQRLEFMPLFLAIFQATEPYHVMTITALLLLFVGSCEYILGTRQAILVCSVAHVAGYVGTSLLVWLFAVAGFHWALQLTAVADVGASLAAFGAAGMVLPFLPVGIRKVGSGAFWLYLGISLLISQQLWDFEHLIAFVVGVMLGLRLLRRRGLPWPALVLRPKIGRRQQPILIAWVVGVLGFVNVLSSFVAPHQLATIGNWLPFEWAETSRSLSVVLGIASLVLVSGLARAKRQAWLLTLVVVGASAILRLAEGPDIPEALSAGALCSTLWAWRGAFQVRSDQPTLRLGYRTLLLLLVVVPVYGVVGIYMLRGQYRESYHVITALQATGARMWLSNAVDYTPLTRQAGWLLRSIPIVGWSALIGALAMVLRNTLVPQTTAPEREQAQQLLRVYGRNTTSYMTLWLGNRLFFGPDNRCYLSYRVAAGVALVLGDPVGPDRLLDPTVAAFEQFCREQGWEPAFYACSSDTLVHYQRRGYRVLKVGEEAFIPLPTLQFRGKAWQDVRTAINRAAHMDLTFKMYVGGTIPAAVRDQIFAISAEWLAGKGLPELGFTLGTADDIDDPNVYVTVVLDPHGQVLAFADWLPIYAINGWVIDLMRRRSEAPGGVMEFLIASALLDFKNQGAQVASLSAAPLANVDRSEEPGSLQRVLELISRRFDRFYHFQSLFAFKRKFQPLWQGTYLVYGSAIDVPRITLAVVRAHMPDLGPRQLAELVGMTISQRVVGHCAAATSPMAHPAHSVVDCDSR
ncbi:MAG: hypothetical protein NVS4B8_04930 [Herpetosiphon sp.]